MAVKEKRTFPPGKAAPFPRRISKSIGSARGRTCQERGSKQSPRGFSCRRTPELETPPVCFHFSHLERETRALSLRTK